MPTSSAADGLRPGDAVLIRSVFRGRVRWCVPHRFVGADGRYLERSVRGDPPCDLVWSRSHVLQLVWPGDAHTVEVFWDEHWSLLGWYANLQAPLRRTPLGFDTTDWALDVVADANGTARWKDEAGAAAVRAEGERMLAARPWPTGWEGRRPPADWAPLPLPEGWDDVA